DRQYAVRKIKPGDRYSFQHFDPFLGLTIPTDVRAVRAEEVDVLEAAGKGDKATLRRVPRKLLRVEVTPRPIEVGGRKLQLPGTTVGLDDDRRPVREEMEIPGLGAITHFRTTREVARKEGIAPARLPNLTENSRVKLARRIDRPNSTYQVRYRIRL